MTENKIPEIIEIDEVLMDRWFELPAGKSLELGIPRGAFDFLYAAIQGSFEVNGRLTLMLQKVAAGEKIDGNLVEEQVQDLADGMNALRRFQTVLMAMATNSVIDTEGRVKNKEESGE